MSKPGGLSSRAHRVLSTLRHKTPRDIARYAASQVLQRLHDPESDFLVLNNDVADSHALAGSVPRVRPAGSRPRVAWLAFPPGAGSGGHTTLFRVMESVRAAGFENTLLLYDRYKSDLESRVATVRSSWPWLQADVEPAPDRITGYDAVVATSWPTAHVVAARVSEGRRLYFIQDYEPLFYPRGATYAFAEDTYRFGFRNIALGQMVHNLLEAELGVPHDVVPFGCDTQTYHITAPAARRSGVTFYAKKGNDRRGYSLAIRALERFHERHPEEPIHVYGERVDGVGFPAVNHGNIAPEQLNELYNGVVAGLALSFTNISLVAEELLASGAIPVVNDGRLPRADFPSQYAVWADATPVALAEALSAAVERSDRDEHAVRAAASVVGRSWELTGSAVARIIAEEVGFDLPAIEADSRGARPGLEPMISTSD